MSEKLTGHNLRSIANDHRRHGHHEHFNSTSQADTMADTAEIKLRNQQRRQYNKLRNQEKRFNLSDQEVLDMTLDQEQKVKFRKVWK